MKKTVIPWHVFLDALERLPQGKGRDEWLQRWRFSEAGAILRGIR